MFKKYAVLFEKHGFCVEHHFLEKMEETLSSSFSKQNVKRFFKSIEKKDFVLASFSKEKMERIFLNVFSKQNFKT